jgi:hypothetical protein
MLGFGGVPGSRFVPPFTPRVVSRRPSRFAGAFLVRRELESLESLEATSGAAAGSDSPRAMRRAESAAR